MRRTFAQTTPLIVVMAIFFQGFICPEDVVAEEVVSVRPGAEAPIAKAEPNAKAADCSSSRLPKENAGGASLFRHSTYPAAWTAAQKSNRPILVYVSMPNCPHCVKMVKKTYERPEVGKLVSSSFESIYADRYTHAKLVQMLDVQWYPTTILVGPNNQVLDVIEGYVDSKTFQRRLQTGLAAASSTTQTR